MRRQTVTQQTIQKNLNKSMRLFACLELCGPIEIVSDHELKAIGQECDDVLQGQVPCEHLLSDASIEYLPVARKAIAAELHARGIGAEPWWSSRRNSRMTTPFPWRSEQHSLDRTVDPNAGKLAVSNRRDQPILSPGRTRSPCTSEGERTWKLRTGDHGKSSSSSAS